MTLPDVVYPLREKLPLGGAELRHSLRSLANLPHGRVWVASRRRPEFLSDEVGFVRLREGSDKWRNLPVALAELCGASDADEVVLMNDDFFVMRSIRRVSLMHRGAIGEHRQYAKPTSAWGRGFHETESLLRRWGVDEEPLLNYEVHAPIEFNRAQLALTLSAAMSEFKGRCLHARTLYGNCFRTGDHPPRERVEDFKVYGRQPSERDFLSTNETSFAHYPAGEAVRAQFPNRCSYERADE